MTRTLVVTNDFPPRLGGIQTFVEELVRRRPEGSVVVYTSSWGDTSLYDARQPFPIVRYRRSVLLPTPDVARHAVELLRSYGCDSALFGAAAPLGLLGPRLRAAGADRIIALTHGHEAGWAGVPGGSPLLRRIGEGVDVVTYLGSYTRTRIAAALSPAAAARMAQLTPGVDDTFFRPDADGESMRRRYGLRGRKVIVCVSRLMPRKGQDVLIEALPAIRSRVPDAALLIVGGGPYHAHLRRLVDSTGVREHVVLTGAVPWAELPAHYAAGDVFAMPCRTRNRGLDVEGLGIVYLEASATGLPVVAGDSGGAPDAVLDGETGYVVPGRDLATVAERISGLLLDEATAGRLGRRGRAWVEEQWRWEQIADRFDALLAQGGRLSMGGV
jgi:phosphatidyl-myo-inositol dimannoside synthase